MFENFFSKKPEKAPAMENVQVAKEEVVTQSSSDFKAQMIAEGKQVYTMPDGSQSMPLTHEEYVDALAAARDNQN